MEKFYLSKYQETNSAISNLDHLDDALDIAAFLGSEEFVKECLIEKHGKSRSEAKNLSVRIASHASLAKKYAELTVTSPPEISFLSGYYSILNLVKVCCLAGPYSNEFSNHTRWHGVTYNGQAKTSQGLLTEEITIKRGGALALFYKTLSGASIASDRTYKLRDIYPLVPGISAEVSLITGQSSQNWCVEFKGEMNGNKAVIEASVFQQNSAGNRTYYEGNVAKLPPLRGFRKKSNVDGVFTKNVSCTSSQSIPEVAREHVKTQFLDIRHEGYFDVFPEQSSRFPITGEFAAALAFFHLSSVCRYNPELMEKLVRSKAYPMMLVMRRHTLCAFIFECWSFIAQKNYYMITRSS